MNTPGENYLQFMFGWHHGAGRRAMDQNRVKQQDVALAMIYLEGYKKGQADGRRAGREASERFSYEPSVIKMTSSETTEVGKSLEVRKAFRLLEVAIRKETESKTPAPPPPANAGATGKSEHAVYVQRPTSNGTQ